LNATTDATLDATANETTALLEVYTDGQCPLCQWMRARVEPFDREGRLEWLDLNSPEALRRAAPHTHAELAAEMYARRKTDGAWAKGFFAWIEVLRLLPRLRWLAHLFARWPFTSVGPVFYRQLARRRYQLFGIPPPCDDTGVCQLHAKK
jgi:predicted DCC family thiol-disulfide oxidoreductase YuxK